MNKITTRDFAPADPILPLYEAWRAARATWYELSSLPNNSNWDAPESRAAEAREHAAFSAMLDILPTTTAGFAALADVLWSVNGPSLAKDHPSFAAECDEPGNRLMIALWRAASGQDGLPPSAADGATPLNRE
ncbi:hypothetical protein [Paracoccus sphaerophysae]|uniref:hypothetical protein n=1 Tax=Paracoccus sphaerophysae TaxID=690417 RepID=UPI0023582E05|nr:hypothetical protein [Paracoccus sphaerophysae]